MANPSADVEVISLDTVYRQLKAHGIKIPGHASASLERSRQAIVQLSAAGLLTNQEYIRLKKRFSKHLVPHTIRIYRGHRRV